MAQRGWVFNPHTGGVTIPQRTRQRTMERIQKYAAKCDSGKYTRFDIRFRGALCYVDAYVEPAPPSKALLKQTGEPREKFLERTRAMPVHLCRPRHFAEDRWSMAFFAYSAERYEPCVFPNGTFFGTPEEAFGLAVGHLD